MLYIQSMLLKIKTALPTIAIATGFAVMLVAFVIALLNWQDENAYIDCALFELVGAGTAFWGVQTKFKKEI